MNSPTCDVIVVGAAMVGSTAALALARAGLRVTLLERRPLDIRATSPDLGQTAVSAGSAHILDALGIEANLPVSAQPILRVHVSQQSRFGSTRIDAGDMGLPALGYVLDNATFINQLYRQIDHCERITVVAPAAVQSLTQGPELVTVSTSDQSFSSRLLLAVDGSHSRLRELCAIDCRVTDYDQCALLSSVTTELDHRDTAFERFTPEGPLALLPLANKQLSLIMTANSAAAEDLRELHDDAFVQRTQKAFGYRLGRMVQCGSRQVVPLQLREADRQCKGRVVLLGNAARLLHPVAGQGFNLALRDIGKLLELITHADTDPGAESLLTSFQAARSSDQRATVRLTDVLARGFIGKHQGVSHLRSLGLIGLDAIPWLRAGLARRAMGFTAGLPDLQPRTRLE